MRNIQFPTNLEINTPSIIDITDDLPKNPAYTWKELTGERIPEEITTIVLHHSGMAKSRGCTAENHANSHIKNKKYEKQGEPGIPYHIHIIDGQAYQVNDLLDFTYGAASHNGYTVHICVEGEYSKNDTLTDPDRLALYGAVLAVKAVLSIQEIKGHGELNPTACPGYDVDKVREDIKTLEMKLQRENTIQARRERAFAVVNQCQYLYSFIGKNDGEETWALNYLDDVHAIMKDKGLL